MAVFGKAGALLQVFAPEFFDSLNIDENRAQINPNSVNEEPPNVFEALQYVYPYMLEALTPKSPIYQRILSTKGESKIQITKNIYAIEQSYPLKLESKAFFESHKEFVDFQLIVRGQEYFLIAPSGECTIEEKYDAEKDLLVYKTPNHCSRLFLNAGTLAVFFPQDVHAGGLGLEDFGGATAKKIPEVHKVVLKVPLELFP